MSRQDLLAEDDELAASRKKDHLDLAMAAQINAVMRDQRFTYEPLFASHPTSLWSYQSTLANKTLKGPLWISSMTGGTALGGVINKNLALAANHFGLAMGLGSCRSLLDSDKNLADFAVRQYIGPDLPLFANLGIAQLELLFTHGQSHRIKAILQKLDADGLIIHVNPAQEWMQPEGDLFREPPIDTIQRVLDMADYPVIVKEVGQGMGYESLKTLLQLPLEAIEFGALGGTSFTMVELKRSQPVKQEALEALAHVGHTADDMVHFVQWAYRELGASKISCKKIIVSGGLRSFLDGYYLIQKLPGAGLYGQAAPLLKYARESYTLLEQFISWQMQGWRFAETFLRVK